MGRPREGVPVDSPFLGGGFTLWVLGFRRWASLAEGAKVMVHAVRGDYRGEGRRFALVASRFHEPLTERLVQGALDALRRHGVEEEAITVVWVPGSLELTPVALQLARSGRFDAVIALGVVLRGETLHFELVCQQASRGLLEAAMQSGRPVLFGVVTADTLEQALHRCGGKSGNRGFDAALAALEMVSLYDQLGFSG